VAPVPAPWPGGATAVSRDLTAALVEVCDETLRRLPPGPTREAVATVRARLLSPLRVAVAGSVSSGKSTLVNALLGQRVAPVDAGECTRLVTWYRYDHHQHIEVQRRDGTVHTVPFASGTRIPDELGAPPGDIARLVVHLSNERLRDITIIDTPGLNTVTDENERATAEALGLGDGTREAGDSQVAMSDADALLFLTPHVRESDVAVLERFRALFDASGLSSANAVGILSKVDRLAPDGDPWPVAHRLATAARERLSAVVSEVVPVMGLLAETSATDHFTEDDAYALAALAGMDELDLEDALLSPQDLLDAEVPDVSRDRRRRLLSMLDLHGIAVGVELVQGGARGAGALLRGFRERSGLVPLTTTVEAGFARRASALKARGGLSDLRRIAAQAGGEDAAAFQALAGPLERIELDPALHDLRILDALRAAEEGTTRLPDDLLDALRRLALETTPVRQLGLDESADPGEVARAASRAVAAWARYGNDSRRSPVERRLAEDVREWYELVWDQATPRPAAPTPPPPGPATGYPPTAPPPGPGPQPGYPQAPAPTYPQVTTPPAPGYPQPTPQGYPQPTPPPGYPQPTGHPQAPAPGYPQPTPSPPGHPQGTPPPGYPQPGPPGYPPPTPPPVPGHPQPGGSPQPAPPGYPPPTPPPSPGYPQPVPGYPPPAPGHPPASTPPSGPGPAPPGPPVPPGGPGAPQPAAPPPRQAPGARPAADPAPVPPPPTPPPAPPVRDDGDDDDPPLSTPWTRRR